MDLRGMIRINNIFTFKIITLFYKQIAAHSFSWASIKYFTKINTQAGTKELTNFYNFIL
jgi:hypothetical protein